MPSASKRKLPATESRFPRGQRSRHTVSGSRGQGLRPIQIWVPDTRSPKFAAEASRQSRRVAASRYAAKDQEFIDAVSLQGVMSEARRGVDRRGRR